MFIFPKSVEAVSAVERTELITINILSQLFPINGHSCHYKINDFEPPNYHLELRWIIETVKKYRQRNVN